MAPNALLEFTTHRLRLYQEAARRLPQEADAADLGAELIQSAFALPAEFRRAWRSVISRMESEACFTPEESDGIGKALQVAFDHTSRFLSHLLDWARQHAPDLRSPHALREIEQTATEMAALRKEILHDWPWSDDSWSEPDEARMAEAMEAYQRGDFLDVGDLIRGLQTRHSAPLLEVSGE